MLPTLYSGRCDQEQKSFNNAREILYQVLFEMKRDVAELKKLVHDIMSHDNMDLSSFPSASVGVMSPTSVSSELMNVIQPSVPMQSSLITEKDEHKVYDTEEYVEESLSLIDAEREAVIKALEKNNGKRKYAAQDLQISERTLYRKIKEFGLENNNR